MNVGGMTVGEIGEDELVARITARLPPAVATVLGPGDDAALLRIGGGEVVATTDVLAEGVHFRREWSSAYDIGRKCAAANLADIAAMGAVPTALLVGFACPPATDVAWAEELTDGLRDEAALTGADVAGGDVVRDDHVTVAVTALGELRGASPVLRSGAQAGDVVAVAGRLGWAAAGLAVLRRGFRSPAVLVGAFRRPEPPYAAGPAAARAGAHAMCDISDGLVRDAGRLATASGVALELHRAALPLDDRLVDVGAALGVDPWAWVLTGGEEHALLATFPAGAALAEPWLVVGEVVAGDGVRVDGEPVDGSTGFDHFAAPGGR